MQLTKGKKFSIKIQLALIIAFCIILPMLVLITISGLKFSDLSENVAKDKAISAAHIYAHEIEGNLNRIFSSVNTYTEIHKSLLENGTAKYLTVNEIHNIQKQFLISNNMGVSVYTILMPGTIDDAETGKLNEGLVLLANDHVNSEFSVLDSWDYHFKSNVEDTLQKGDGYMLLPPYIESAIAGKPMLVITYGHAIEIDGEFRGLVGLDISINWIQESTKKINLFDNKTQISIISNTGIINSDNKNDTLVGKNIKDVLPSFEKERVGLMSKEISDTKDGDNYIFYVPIQFDKLKDSWHIRILVPESEILKDAKKELLLRVMFFAIIAIIIILISYLYFNKVVNKITKLAATAKLVAKGNLKIKIQSQGNDEITDLAESIQSIVTRFGSIIHGLKSSLDQLRIATEDLSQTSVKLYEGASEQASSTEQVSSSMEEMGANIEQNTESAKIAETIAKKSSKEIEISSKSVKSTASSMGEIAKKISVINDIAFQVNILALNAAVEAARAGIHGKGFGVVAAEVGKLADKSKLAANEIDLLTSRSYTIARQSGMNLEKIVPEIQKTAILVQDITNASIEQKAGTEQINTAIQQLNSVTQQNASSAEKLASNVESLSLLNDRLYKLISFFKIEENEKKDILRKKQSMILKAKSSIVKSVKEANSNEIVEKETDLKYIKIEGNDKISDDKGFDIDLGEERLDDGFERF